MNEDYEVQSKVHVDVRGVKAILLVFFAGVITGFGVFVLALYLAGFVK